MGPVLTILGLATLLAAVALAVSGASRAVAVWISPVGLAATGMGVLSLRGVAVPRWSFVVLAVVAALMALLGLATLLY